MLATCGDGAKPQQAEEAQRNVCPAPALAKGEHESPLQTLNACSEPQTTARGFEPLRAEPNGFLVHHLNHSVTLSMSFLMLGIFVGVIQITEGKCGK